jgi:hypothetical protein
MKKIFKVIIVLIVIIALAFFVVKSIFHVTVDENEIPQNVYEENTGLLGLVQLELVELFVLNIGNDEYILVEEMVNLVIRDSIRENFNESYDPLGDCETDECNYIVINNNYYVDYVWASLSEENQLILNVSTGTTKLGGFNTITHLYFDIDIDYTSFEVVLTLDVLKIHNTGISIETLNSILSNFDTQEIEDSITKGTLDLEEYTYRFGLILFP